MIRRILRHRPDLVQPESAEFSDVRRLHADREIRREREVKKREIGRWTQKI